MKRIYGRLAVSLAFTFGLVMLTLGAGGTSQAAPLNASDLPGGMAGATWQLESMQTAPPATVRPMEQGTVITLEFDGQGGLSGHGACNDYFASYKAGSNNTITVGPIGSTQKACAQNLMDLDQQYFGVLQSVDTYSTTQGHLGLWNKSTGGIVNYISATPPTSPGMPITGEGPQLLWLLVGLALGLCLTGAGIVANYRRRERRAIRIKVEK